MYISMKWAPSSASARITSNFPPQRLLWAHQCRGLWVTPIHPSGCARTRKRRRLCSQCLCHEACDSLVLSWGVGTSTATPSSRCPSGFTPSPPFSRRVSFTSSMGFIVGGIFPSSPPPPQACPYWEVATDGSRSFHAYCDAIVYGLGAAPEQENPDSSVRLIAYVSRATRDLEWR